ncbi:hypothetical protein VTI74DRAFT_9590 [Chaetomium olivicolor]
MPISARKDPEGSEATFPKAFPQERALDEDYIGVFVAESDGERDIDADEDAWSVMTIDGDLLAKVGSSGGSPTIHPRPSVGLDFEEVPLQVQHSYRYPEGVETHHIGRYWLGNTIQSSLGEASR